jgi:hypothetical protein
MIRFDFCRLSKRPPGPISQVDVARPRNKENRRFPMPTVIRSRAPELVVSLSFIAVLFAYIAASSALA